jgi:hypothetical protein
MLGWQVLKNHSELPAPERQNQTDFTAMLKILNYYASYQAISWSSPKTVKLPSPLASPGVPLRKLKSVSYTHRRLRWLVSVFTVF